MAGGDFADADILLEFLTDFGEVVQLGEDGFTGVATVVEVTGDDPVDIAGVALLGGVAEAGVPHLAGIDAPGFDDVGAALDCLLVKVVECFVTLVGLESFAIDDCYGCGVGGGVVLEFGDQVVEVLEVLVGAWLLVGVDDDGVDAMPAWFGAWWGYLFTLGCAGAGHRGFHGVNMHLKWSSGKLAQGGGINQCLAL
ncbi:MAG: hypothetical protein RI897_744 [Verrucomicrobiota bacterium]